MLRVVVTDELLMALLFLPEGRRSEALFAACLEAWRDHIGAEESLKIGTLRQLFVIAADNVGAVLTHIEYTGRPSPGHPFRIRLDIRREAEMEMETFMFAIEDIGDALCTHHFKADEKEAIVNDKLAELEAAKQDFFAGRLP